MKEFNSFVFLCIMFVLIIVGFFAFAWWVSVSDLPEWFKFFLLK